MSKLNVYNNGTDTYVAESTEHLARMFREHCGYDLDECDPFELVPDDKMIRIGFEDEPENPPGEHTTSKGWTTAYAATAREWAEWNGAGMLCSTEY